MKKKSLSITMAFILQILMAAYMAFIIYLKVKYRNIQLLNMVIFSLAFFHFIGSAQSLWNNEKAGFILTKTNFVVLFFISLGGLFYFRINFSIRVFICLFLLIISGYFLFYFKETSQKLEG